MAATKAHIVRPGEYLDQICFRNGIKPEDTWDLPKNAELREQRADPNLLNPGDILHLPEDSRSPLTITAGATNHYSARVPETTINIVLQDFDGPVANADILVSGLEPLERKFRTDEQGKIRIENIPVTTRSLFLKSLDGAIDMDLRIGELNPIHEVSGWTGRLQNLGFSSLLAFQDSQGISPTGEPDKETIAALEEAYGC